MASGEEAALASDDAANKQIRGLQRLLGKKTMETEILKEAVEFGRTKNGGECTLVAQGRLITDVCWSICVLGAQLSIGVTDLWLAGSQTTIPF